MKQNLLLVLVSILLLAFLQSCVSPFSELQSARLVGKNNVEFTPAYTTTSSTSEGETEGIQNHIGFHSAFGVSSKTDLRLRYELIWGKGDDIGNATHVIGFGPKISLLENRIALSLPFGTAFGGDIGDIWEFQPSVLFTLPAVPDKLDITFAPKYIATFCEDCGDYMAFNFGLAISNDVSSWAIRPEFGLLYDFGSEGHASQFSIGISKTFGKNIGSQK